MKKKNKYPPIYTSLSTSNEEEKNWEKTKIKANVNNRQDLTLQDCTKNRTLILLGVGT